MTSDPSVPGNEDLGFEEPTLEAVADAILDGSPVDWGASQPTASTDPALARQLRVLADVAAIHRAVGREEAGADPPASLWAHLQLREKVGQGAFGEVYRAWDPHVGREVALKLLSAVATGDADSRAWVLHEARALGAVRHPNVITVYGADRMDGRVGFWSEFIHGRTLSELVSQRGRFSADETIAVGIDLCGALSAVHHAGLLHRDIKATNVMREDGGRLVLLDFGASRDFDRGTGTGQISLQPYGPTGTPLYVAPELWHGGSATPQSDIYSLGVLLYFLVTGSYPVRGTITRDVAEAHDAHRRMPLDVERPDLPGVFVAAVERAIDPEPTKRFENAEAFQSALAAARGASTRSHTWKRWPVLGAAAALILLGGAYLEFARPWLKRREPPAVVFPSEIQIPSVTMSYPSRDGRFMTYIDGSGGLRVFDVHAGTSRVIRASSGPDDSAVSWVDFRGRRFPRFWTPASISPTNDRVVYTWTTGEGVFELLMSDLEGRWTRTLVEPRRGREPTPVGWSNDGGEIVCWFVEHDESDLVRVSVADGSTALVYHRDGGTPSTTLSPDGRFVTLEVRAPNEEHFYLASVEVTGTVQSPRPAVPTVSDEMRSAGWLDNTHLFFLRRSTTKTASWDGWVARISEGVAVGEPIKVADNLGANTDVAVATDPVTGEHRVYAPTSRIWNEVYSQTIDLTGQVPPGPRIRISPEHIDHHCCASISPDGQRIAYFTGDSRGVVGLQDRWTLTIQDVATGKVTPVSPAIEEFGGYNPQWAGNEHALFMLGATRLGDPMNYYKVNVETGDTQLIAERVTPLSVILPDASGFVYRDNTRGLVERTFARSDEHVIVPMNDRFDIGRFRLSPDGASIAFIGGWKKNGIDTTVLEVAARDGTVHDIYRSVGNNALDFQAWTPDGKQLLFTEGVGVDPRAVLIISVDGGAPRDTHLKIPKQTNPLSLSLAGRVVYSERVTQPALFIRLLPQIPKKD